MEELTQNEKSKVLEDAVFLKNPEEVSEMMSWLGKLDNSAHALGLACRFRGLKYVKALVEGGASFIYFHAEGHTLGGYKYAYALLDMNKALNVEWWIDRRSLVCKKSGTVDDGKGGEVTVNLLPIEERVEIVRYLYETREKTGFDPDELLFYSIMSGSKKITAALKELGAAFTERRISALTGSSRDFFWQEFCGMSDCLEDSEFIEVMKEIIAETGGKTLHYTDALYYGNYNAYRKQFRLYDPEFFKFLLDNFNQKKMNKTQFMKGAIERNSVECLEICAENGWLKQPRKRDEMIKFASDNERTECVAYLLDFKNRTADLAAEQIKAEKKMQRELNADPNSVTEMRKVWSFDKLEDGTLVIKRYKGKSIEVEVPEKIGKDTVSVIGAYAFSPGAPRLTRDRSDFLNTVTKITLPNTIKVIEDHAFYYCKGLESVNIPDSVEKLGEHGFCYCYKLPAAGVFEIPDSVKELGESMFSACTNLEYIKLPSETAEIFDYMFSGCQKLKEIKIPDTVKRIGIWGFKDCKELTKVVIPEGVEEIGRQAFVNCSNLETVVLPASIKQIKNYKVGNHKPQTIFHNSVNVTAVVVPKSYAEKYCKRNEIPYRYSE